MPQQNAASYLTQKTTRETPYVPFSWQQRAKIAKRTKQG